MNAPWELRMDANRFTQNIGAQSPEKLAAYLDQHVAWSEDGREILAHARELSDLYADLDRRGIARYVIGYIPADGLSDLGGAELEV
jgi:hypothetical protein